MPSRTVSLDRRHSLAGRDNLEWFFAHRKWIRTSSLSSIECAWAKRPLPIGDRSPTSEAGIRFLLLAPKRSHKRAHDRNKLRRWLRAAITETEAFFALEEKMFAACEQLLLMMRISKPVNDVNWDMVLADIRTIGEHLKKRV